MLACQLVVVLLSAVKRFEHKLLHWAHTLREKASTVRNWRTGTEAEF